MLKHNYHPIQAPQVHSADPIKKKIGLEGERKVFLALVAALKDRNEYFFRYSLPQKNLSNRPDSEIDFVIYKRNYGLIFLEVKNWASIVYIPQHKTFGPNSGVNKDPFWQMDKAAVGFRKLFHIKNAASNQYDETIAKKVVVVSRDTDWLRKHKSAYHVEDYWGVDIALSPEKLKEAIEAEFELMPRKSFDHKTMMAILTDDNFEESLALCTSIAEMEAIYERDTHSVQSDYVNRMRHGSNWIVAGEAGTGKSYTALNLATKLQSKGQKGVFLVFNGAIQRYLSEIAVSKYKLHIERMPILTLQSFVNSYLGLKDLKVLKSRQDFGHRDKKTILAALQDQKRLDFLIIDEVQDLSLDTISVLQQGLNDPKSGLYVFVDAKQDLSLSGRHSTPESFMKGLSRLANIQKPLILNKVVRNNPKIVESVKENIDLWTAQPLPIDSGIEVIHYKESTLSGLHARTRNIMTEWMSKHNLGVSDIVVLGNRKLENFFGVHSPQMKKLSPDMYIGATPPTDVTRENRVQFYSVTSFKGCESKAVILWWNDSLPPKSKKSAVAYYIAASRAKHLLAVIKFRR